MKAFFNNLNKNFPIKLVTGISLLLFIIGCQSDPKSKNSTSTSTSAVSGATQLCDDRVLCHFAIDVANRFANHPKQTCYQPEAQSHALGLQSPDIDLGENLHARTGAAGWVAFALSQNTPQTQKLYDELSALNPAGSPWTPAYLYHNHFQQLANGEKTSTVLKGGDDLANLQAGDILSWCNRGWCDGSSTAGDSGYVAIVVDVVPINRSEIVAHLKTTPDTAQFWRVTVVDSSHQVHSSHLSETHHVVDHRIHASSPHHNECSINGGLGAGAIFLAQWEDTNNQRQWGHLFFNDPNHAFKASSFHPSFRVAFGRPL